MPQIGFTDTPSFYVEKLTTKTPMPAMHHHKTYELFYVVRGGREYFIEEGFYRLSEGDLVIIPKNLLHRTDGRDATRYLVYFSYDYLARFFTAETLGALSLDRPFVFRGEGAEREYLNRIFAALLSDYMGVARERNPEDDPVLAGYLYQILFTLTNSSNLYVPESYSDSRIEKIVRYINENFHRIGDIDEIASHFYISKYHLCRIFKENLGVGLVAYLNTVKIRAACEMIKEKSLSLTEISSRCGFNSPSYFCKVFRLERAMSPSEYKRRLNK